MSGTLFSQQGLYGVAATQPRPPQKVVPKDRLRVTGSSTSRLDLTTAKTPAHPQPQSEKDQPEQPVGPHVASATLLEASLIASALVDGDNTGFAPVPTPSRQWQPPASALRLRDRSV